MDTKNLTIVIVVAVIFLVVGGAVGMTLQSSKDATAVAGYAKLQPAVEALSSKVVPSIIAYGQVTNIEGKNLTLSYSGQTLVVAVAQNANIYSFVAPAAGSKVTTPTQRKATFAEIKKGDNLNISLKLSSDGKLEGQSVIILMSTAK